jgi:hypothetical protein
MADMTKRHAIVYSDTVINSQSQIEFDTTVNSISRSDTVIFYRINPTTKKVIRICREQNSIYLLYEKNRVDWKEEYGMPNEFIGPYLFSDVHRGGLIEGVITKMKFKIGDKKVHLIDSITGGSYSEGAGTWEWLISNTGKPEAIVFHGGDRYFLDDRKLLITPADGSMKTFLIDLSNRDTILSLSRPGREIWHQLILKNGILFSTQAEPRFSFIKLYNLKGELLWTAKSDYLEKLLAVPEKNLIIGSGYYFPGGANSKIHFTVAYNLDSGQMTWSFPTLKALYPKLDSKSAKVNFLSTTNLFVVGKGLYGMTVQVSVSLNNYFSVNNAVRYYNKLIVFDSQGYLFRIMDLPESEQEYSDIQVVNKSSNEFEVVSKYENWNFKVKSR